MVIAADPAASQSEPDCSQPGDHRGIAAQGPFVPSDSADGTAAQAIFRLPLPIAVPVISPEELPFSVIFLRF